MFLRGFERGLTKVLDENLVFNLDVPQFGSKLLKNVDLFSVEQRLHQINGNVCYLISNLKVNFDLSPISPMILLLSCKSTVFFWTSFVAL